MSRKPPAAPGGVIVIDKPAGMTSHDVVSRVRRIVGSRRVGHAGTLDPMATGVLVLGVERATRLLNFLPLDGKAYQARIRLGAATDTDDAEGAVVAGSDAGRLPAADIDAAMLVFTGDIFQVPSSVSALKIAGERAHALVRAGATVVLQSRPVTVSRFARTSDPQASGRYLDFDVEVQCSAGTYVRALARDLGDALGVGGHLLRLRRTSVGPFTLAAAIDLDELATRDQPIALPLPAAIAAAMQVRVLDPEEAAELSFGRTIAPIGLVGTHGGFDEAGRAVALLAESAGRSRPVLGFIPAGSGAADL